MWWWLVTSFGKTECLKFIYVSYIKLPFGWYSFCALCLIFFQSLTIMALQHPLPLHRPLKMCGARTLLCPCSISIFLCVQRHTLYLQSEFQTVPCWPPLLSLISLGLRTRISLLQNLANRCYSWEFCSWISY